jgi:hypothetical protein
MCLRSYPLLDLRAEVSKESGLYSARDGGCNILKGSGGRDDQYPATECHTLKNMVILERHNVRDTESQLSKDSVK